MDAGTENKFLTAYSNAFQMPWSGSIHEWASENITLTNDFGQPGAFTVHQSPYLIPIFDAVLDPDVEQVNFYGARQIFKSGLSEISIAYWAQTDPAPIIRMMHVDEAAEVFAKTRLVPILQNCKSLKDTSIKYSAKTGLIDLPHIKITITGNKESALIGKTCRRLLVDEFSAESWKEDTFTKALHTTNAFIGRRKIVITTTPGVKGDQASKQADKGKVYLRAWTCTQCNQSQPWYWNEPKKRDDGTIIEGNGYGITWTPYKDVDGKYDYQKTGDSAYLECKYCNHQIKDDERTRITLEKSATYLLIKDGDSKCKTYIVPAWVNPKITFKEKITDYLKAKQEARYGGNKKNLINFYQHVLAQEWDEKVTWTKPKVRIEAYDPNAAWKDEVVRGMFVDYQAKGERYYIIIAADIKGNARVIKYGKAYSWDEIDTLAKDNKVPKAHVVVDCGHDQTTVLAELSKRGEWIKEIGEDGQEMESFNPWLAFKGHKDPPKGGFEHSDGVRRYYDEGQEMAVGNDCPNAIMYLWAANPVRNIFGKLRDGTAREKWVIPSMDQDFINQLYAEVKEEDKDGVVKWVQKHKDNHYFDCMCMGVAFFLMAGIPLGGSEDIKKA